MIRRAFAVVYVVVGVSIGLLVWVDATRSSDLSAADLALEAHQDRETRVSPVRRIERQTGPLPYQPSLDPSFRSIDGSGNNLETPTMNARYSQLRRFMAEDYADGVSQMAGQSRPDPRIVSNLVNAQQKSIPDPRNASDFLWQWGQFLDHDIDLTGGTDPVESEDILIPTGDPFFDPQGTGTAVLPFNRSIYDPDSGTGAGNSRQQLNEITGWIDASNVYGSDPERAHALRTNDNTGRLRTSEGDLLPFNTDGLANAGGTSDALFLAGDVRANEQVGLTALHTLFVREHNRLATKIAAEDPSLSGDEIYERARRLVGAQLQVITYNEFLPALLGPKALRPYRGYNPKTDAQIMNAFSTAAYRFGHSLLNSYLLRLDAEGNEIPAGHLQLRDAFFAPQRITDEGGIEPLLRGLASQVCQDADVFIIDEVRNFLFGDPGEGGFDLASLNIQRGRDHGLPSYNDAREKMGLKRAYTFADISSDPEIQARLASVYDSPDAVDLWIGGLAEDHHHGAMVGELFFTVLKQQFEALRDGDRFWFQRSLNREELREINGTKLADIIRRNTSIDREISDDVFHVRRGRRLKRRGHGES